MFKYLPVSGKGVGLVKGSLEKRDPVGRERDRAWFVRLYGEIIPKL